MNPPASLAGPVARGLFALFPPTEYLAHVEPVPPTEIPPPYHGLLVHPHHMTVTIEEHHHETVDVRILEEKRGEDVYARKILLVTQQSHRVVQFGLVRVHLEFCPAAVRKELLAGQTPLGRILIQHDILRRIEPTLFFRIVPGPAMLAWFGLKEPNVTFGRQALIYCEGKPAVELLEIVAPEPLLPKPPL